VSFLHSWQWEVFPAAVALACILISSACACPDLVVLPGRPSIFCSVHTSSGPLSLRSDYFGWSSHSALVCFSWSGGLSVPSSTDTKPHQITTWSLPALLLKKWNSTARLRSAKTSSLSQAHFPRYACVPHLCTFVTRACGIFFCPRQHQEPWEIEPKSAEKKERRRTVTSWDSLARPDFGRTTSIDYQRSDTISVLPIDRTSCHMRLDSSRLQQTLTAYQRPLRPGLAGNSHAPFTSSHPPWLLY
jgi:hypothetical protein